MRRLPNLLEHQDAGLTLLRQGPAALFTDIDGTLAPIVSDPLAAVVPHDTRVALEALAERVPVVALTGRGVSAAHGFIGLDSVVYSGNHGAEWLEDGKATIEDDAAPYVGKMHTIALQTERKFAGQSVFVEDKGPSVSVHYRNTSDPSAARGVILDFLTSVAEGMTLREGKMVVEVRPPVALSKGVAVRSFVRRRGLASALVVGDDLSDAEAFVVVRGMRDAGEVRALCVAVGAGDAPEELLAQADYVLNGPAEVGRYLGWLASVL